VTCFLKVTQNVLFILGLELLKIVKDNPDADFFLDEVPKWFDPTELSKHVSHEKCLWISFQSSNPVDESNLKGCTFRLFS